MEKNTEAVRKPVELPEGYMCRDTCGMCDNLNRNDKTNDGRFLCNAHDGRYYVKLNDFICPNFVPSDPNRRR